MRDKISKFTEDVLGLNLFRWQKKLLHDISKLPQPIRIMPRCSNMKKKLKATGKCEMCGYTEEFEHIFYVSIMCPHCGKSALFMTIEHIASDHV